MVEPEKCSVCDAPATTLLEMGRAFADEDGRLHRVPSEFDPRCAEHDLAAQMRQLFMDTAHGRA